MPENLDYLQRKIAESLNDPRPGIPHEEVMEKMRSHVAKKLQNLLAQIDSHDEETDWGPEVGNEKLD